ncbi:hypothetical protein NQZ68_026330 [Dissostichus eleginoides]|nr:hypothetical protein NQZ68_026330 [Dissostichus eleginoides]
MTSNLDFKKESEIRIQRVGASATESGTGAFSQAWQQKETHGKTIAKIKLFEIREERPCCDHVTTSQYLRRDIHGDTTHVKGVLLRLVVSH